MVEHKIDDIHLPALLHRYRGADFSLQLKARFLFYTFLTCIVITVLVIGYSAYIQLKNPVTGGFNLSIIFIESTGFIIFIGCFILLIRGRFKTSAHVMLISVLVSIWSVMAVDRSEPVIRLDTVIFVPAILSMLPIAIVRKKRAIPIYLMINVMVFFVFVAGLKHYPGLSDIARFDYLADTTMSLIFMGVVSYNIFRINNLSLDQAESDINERKKAERSLRRSEEHYRTLFEASADSIFIMKNQIIVDCNTAMTRLFDCEKEDILGLSPYEFSPDKQEDDMDSYEKSIAYVKGALDGTIQNFEWLHKRFDDSLIYVDVILSALDLDSDVYLQAIVRDITDRKNAEKERKKLEAQLLQAQKMEAVGRLAGGVAHDFNNMLSIISGRSELALMDLPSTDRFYHDFTEIKAVAKRSADLTRQLLAFARKQTIAPEILNLNDTIERMLTMLRRLIGEDIDLLWKPCGESCTVEMDPSQIDQLIANLVVNARDSISDIGNVTIETDFVYFDEKYAASHAGFVSGHFVLLAVSDDGCGMDKVTQENIFEPFYTTKIQGKGTGLGLATVYGIVKQNKGFINVYSELNQGTTFKIYFPVTSGEPVQKAGMAMNNTAFAGSETILLVEDEPAILDVAKTMLESLGYTLVSAETPYEAVRLAADYTDRIDLLMTDVIMPGMNGKDLAGKIKMSHPNVSCLFMSGYTANVIAHHGVLDKGVHFIEKPFSMMQLAIKVRETLNSREPEY